EEGRVLLLRHTYWLKKPWGLPGGGLHPGETLEECLRREVLEETGMKIEIKELLSAAAHFDRRLVDMVFSCRPANGASLASFKPNAEVAEARFFALSDFPEDMATGIRRLIEVAIKQAEGDRSVLYGPARGEMP